MFRLRGIALIGGAAALSVVGGSALALPGHQSEIGPSIVWPVADEENEAIDRDLETDEVPTTKSGGQMIPAPDRAESDSSDIEDKELKRDLDTGE